MSGGVFLAYQTMCDGCEHKLKEPNEKLKACKDCNKLFELNKRYRTIKFR